jgi:AcrR family transcriptional regulator
MSKRARRKEQRPGEILAAAFEAFSERGYEATRLEDVAALAGVTKGTIYVYFETKEQLFEEMVRRYSSGIMTDADAILAATNGSCAEKLRALLAFIYGRCVQDRIGREILRFIAAESRIFPNLVDEHYHEFIVPAQRLIDELLQCGMSTGEFKINIGKDSAPIILAPVVYFAIFNFVFRGFLSADNETYIGTHIDLILNGIRT